MSTGPAGWHPDPYGRNEYRYWDGQQWTSAVSSGGVQATDAPIAAPQGPPAYVAPVAPGESDQRSAASPLARTWRKFRALPLWAQVVAWVALLAIVGALGSSGKNDSKASGEPIVVDSGSASKSTTSPAADPTSTVVATTATTEAATTTSAPPPPTTPPTPAPTSQAPARPTMTPSQQAAVRSAESYLEFKGFSRQGLIDQLSSEYGDQFSVADATFAVESLTVDWNEQAARSAQSYLEFKGFSCQGLIDQLSSEYGDQFTAEQARFGAAQVGLC